ncbi:MAG: carbohydrate-binding family 9-like protein [Trueperaceae bacterium]
MNETLTLSSHLVACISSVDIENADWSEIPSLSPFTLSDGSSSARQQTQVRLTYSSQALHVRFDCHDDDIWGTYTKRNDPIYNEEVVEVFIAPGTETPQRYFEFEISPKGVLFNCIIDNPSGQYDQRLVVEKYWDTKELLWQAEASSEIQTWWALLTIPWEIIGGFHTRWRANFYRIERSKKSGTEFSCWSPTFSHSFHVPAYFGLLEMQETAED